MTAISYFRCTTTLRQGSTRKKMQFFISQGQVRKSRRLLLAVTGSMTSSFHQRVRFHIGIYQISFVLLRDCILIDFRIFIALIDNDQLNGTLDSNPFFFRRLFREYDTHGNPNVANDVYIRNASMAIQGVDISGPHKY